MHRMLSGCSTRANFARVLLRQRICAAGFVLMVGITAFAAPRQNKTAAQDSQLAASAPSFGENDALVILGTLQTTLQSYDRKKFLGCFDSARMPNFSAFRNEINGLFNGYDSFVISYHLTQAAMEGEKGVVLADFGLDATSNSDSDEALDLRRHTQLRLVLAWDGKEWKIVDLSPRAIFRRQ